MAKKEVCMSIYFMNGNLSVIQFSFKVHMRSAICLNSFNFIFSGEAFMEGKPVLLIVCAIFVYSTISIYLFLKVLGTPCARANVDLNKA